MEGDVSAEPPRAAGRRRARPWVEGWVAHEHTELRKGQGAEVVPTPTQEYRRTGLAAPRKLPSGADALVDTIVGVYRRRTVSLRALRRDAQAIERLGPALRDLSDSRLRQTLAEHRTAFRSGRREACNQALCPALAAVREVSQRRAGLRPYPVQLMGALALHRGYLVEMATGEGKTLVAALAAVLAAWTRRPCHIVTVNDYLAQRDAEWFRPVYAFCGVQAGFITGAMEPSERRQAYAQDVAYATSKEILADFLRDRLHLGPLQNASRRHIQASLQGRAQPDTANALVMRGLHTCIVDEADSILIDEAVTPLIISQAAPNDELKEACQVAQRVAAQLLPRTDYSVDPRNREATLTEAGQNRVAEHGRELGGIWQAQRRWSELIEQALTAREFFELDKQYVKQDEQIVIVDEFTGRLMPQRTWRHGLHQAVEAKEGLAVSDPNETLGRLSFQRFFRFFRCLSGMTGTAREASRELWRIYRLPVIALPTNQPCRRRLLPDRVFATEADKWDAVTGGILELHATGRPLLVGTRSVLASERLADRLRTHGVELNLLNAIRHREEAQVIAEAGNWGKITIATNMAGRGTDIRLGRGVADLSGLHVIATERHESGRIDRQLFGRSARQGDPGSAQAFVSLEDELFVRFLPVRLLRVWIRALLATAVPGSRRLAALAIRWAQHAAQKQAAKRRRTVSRMDTWLNDSLSFTRSSDRIE